MTDLGSFSVESGELREESTEWRARKKHLSQARALVDNGLNKGYKFGFFANAAGLDDFHDKYIQAMVDALDDGEDTFDFIAAALASTANAYDGVDATSAESAAALKKRLPS